jgi:hypothetical protein
VAAGRDPRGAQDVDYTHIRAIDRVLSRAESWRGVIVPEMDPREMAAR